MKSPILTMTTTLDPHWRRHLAARPPRDSTALAQRILAAILSAILLTAVGFGQDEEDDSDGVYELSPFVIEASDEKGYSATSALSGSRLKTPLRDVGASIPVITEQFREDIAADGAGDLLIYTTGTEIGGLGRNFAGGATRRSRSASISNLRKGSCFSRSAEALGQGQVLLT